MTIPPPQLATRIRWKPLALLWLITAILLTLLLINNASLDTLAWRSTRWFTGNQDAYQWDRYKADHATGGGDANAPFYNRIDPPMHAKFYTRTEKWWRLFRDLGEPQLTFILIITVSIFDRRRWKAGLLLLAATAAAGGLGALIRMIGGRYRPIETDGLNQWSLFRGFHEGRDLAFPSGHATLAFATAAALTYLSPKGRCLFITLATLCALTRVVMQAHFYSDALFGATLGWAISTLVITFADRALGVPPSGGVTADAERDV